MQLWSVTMVTDHPGNVMVQIVTHAEYVSALWREQLANHVQEAKNAHQYSWIPNTLQFFCDFDLAVTEFWLSWRTTIIWVLLAQSPMPIQIHVYLSSCRLSNKCDGCPWPSAIKNTAKYCNSVEGKARGLQASCKKCASQNGQQHCCNEGPGVLAVMPTLLKGWTGLSFLFNSISILWRLWKRLWKWEGFISEGRVIKAFV